MTTERCPWRFDFESIMTYYYDRTLSPKIAVGQRSSVYDGWQRDNSIRIACYDDLRPQEFDCGCKAYNLSSGNGAVVSSSHLLGTNGR